MSKSGAKALEAQKAEAQAEAGANPYTFPTAAESARAVLADAALGARVGLQDIAGEAAALDDALARLRADLDRFSGTHAPDAIVLRSDHVRIRLAQLRDSLSMLCAAYEALHNRVQPF